LRRVICCLIPLFLVQICVLINMNGQYLEKIFDWCSIFSPIVPIFFVFLRWQKWKGYTAVIIVLITASLLSDILSSISIKMFGDNYLIIIIYGLLETLIFLYFFSLVINNSRKWLFLLFIFYAVFYIIDFTYLEPGKFNTYGRSVESLIMIILTLLLFFQFYINEEDIFFEKSALFWFNVAILTYFSGAFFSFVLSREIMSGEMKWMLHNTSNILKNIILAIGLWKTRTM